MSVELNVYFPKYIEEFSCVGPACTNSCCVGWSVDVDKKSYMNYKNIANRNEFNKFLISNVRRVRQNQTDLAYAKINMLPDGRCSLLDDDNLCKIYNHLGHDSMSSVCCTYPRAYHHVNGKKIICAHLSCPEIARIALLNKDSMELCYKKISIHSKASFIEMSSSPTNPDYIIKKNFMDILNLSMSIVQNPQFPLEKQLMILGILISKIKECQTDNEISDLLEKFKDDQYLKLYNESLDSLEPKYYMQLKVIIDTAVKTEFTDNDNSARYANYVNISISNIFKHEYDDQNTDNYIISGLSAYRYFLKKNRHIIANYIVNTMLEMCFPLNNKSKKTDIFYSYTCLMIEYIMLRTILTGLLIENMEMDEDKLIDVINLHSRSMIHHISQIESYIDALKAEGTYSLAGILLLIKI